MPIHGYSYIANYIYSYQIIKVYSMVIPLAMYIEVQIIFMAMLYIQ